MEAIKSNILALAEKAKWELLIWLADQVADPARKKAQWEEARQRLLDWEAGKIHPLSHADFWKIFEQEPES